MIVPLVEGIFFGIKPAVLALVLEAVLRIGRRALGHAVQVAIAALAFVAIFFFEVGFPWIVLAAGLTGLVGARVLSGRVPAAAARGAGGRRRRSWTRCSTARRPSTRGRTRRARSGSPSICLALWWAPIAALALARGRGDVFTEIGVFFSQLAVVTFGGAYAVLAYMAQQAVEVYGWLSPREMLDGLGMAETTPGPLIQVVQFVGFLGAYRSPGALTPWVAGTLAAVLTTWVTYVPCFLWIFLGAPYVERLRESRALRGALAGIMAAVVGVVLNLAIWFSLHTLFGVVNEQRLGALVLQVPDWAHARSRRRRDRGRRGGRHAALPRRHAAADRGLRGARGRVAAARDECRNQPMPALRFVAVALALAADQHGRLERRPAARARSPLRDRR